MPAESNPASATIASGLAWSVKTSGMMSGRTLRPVSGQRHA
jgi:hypothetical protein